MTQDTFNFEAVKTPPIRQMILEAMSDGGWWRLEQLAAYCKGKYGKWVSDATISARLRELSKQGHPHETRPRGKGSMAVEYRLGD
jgi:DNA-binding HxlR family transcriptional regulator